MSGQIQSNKKVVQYGAKYLFQKYGVDCLTQDGMEWFQVYIDMNESTLGRFMQVLVRYSGQLKQSLTVCGATPTYRGVSVCLLIGLPGGASKDFETEANCKLIQTERIAPRL